MKNKKKSRRIAEHMHVHHFPVKEGKCSCGITLKELAKKHK